MSRGKFRPYQDPNGRPRGITRAGGQLVTVLVILVAAIAAVASFPVEGLPGAALGVLAMAAGAFGAARTVQAGRDRETQRGIEDALHRINTD